MTSYKNVVKYDYRLHPADIVALKEYIVFDDGKSGEKFAILKFSNNLDQKLYAVEFEARQYDSSDSLIAKTLVLHDKFTADAGETFVPKAKLKLSANCARISVKLISARFDRVKWERGVFKDESYSFERYISDGKKSGADLSGGVSRGKTNVSYVSDPETPASVKRKNGKALPAFAVNNIFGENHARFPLVFAVIAVVLVIAAVIGSAFYVRNKSVVRAIDDFLVEKVTESTVSIVGYDGRSTDVSIPEKIGDYTVAKIGEYAFDGSRITSVTFESGSSEITISPRAFYRCRRLESVKMKGNNSVKVLGYAFFECENIKTVDMSRAVVSKYAFYGSYGVQRYSFANTDLKKDEIFGVKE